MATTQKTASPKKSQGFTGVRGAFWIIVVCAIIAFTLFFTWFANGIHSLTGALPGMMCYLEESYLRYGQSFQLARNNTKNHIPIKADKPS